MKAERRHELKTNALAQKIVSVPDYTRKYAGRAAVVVALVVVIGYILYRRSNAAATAHSNALMALSEARRDLDGVRRQPGGPLDSTFMLAIRSSYENGKALVNDVIGDTDDPKMLAQATLTSGDLALALYQVPVLPGATTNEALRPAASATPESLLNDATAAYQKIVDKYNDQPLILAGAQMGLATVAEEKREFDKAKDNYTKVIKNEAVPASVRSLAQARLDTLKNIQSPAILGDANMPYEKLATTRKSATRSTTTSAPTSGPTTTAPTTKPTMVKPAVVVPATKPTTAPSTKSIR